MSSIPAPRGSLWPLSLPFLALVILAVVGSASFDAVSVAIPETGVVDARSSAHADKHEAGTMPVSQIRAQVDQGHYELWYSAKRSQYLALVRVGSECGGLILRYDQFQDGQWREVTGFGGSECNRQASSCVYWECTIQSDGYKLLTIYR